MGSKTDKSVPAIAPIPIPKISSRRPDIRGAIEPRAGLFAVRNITLSGGSGTRVDEAVPFDLVGEIGVVELLRQRLLAEVVVCSFWEPSEGYLPFEPPGSLLLNAMRDSDVFCCCKRSLEGRILSGS